MMPVSVMDDVPFTLASVLLDDGLARLDLAKSGRPAFKTLVCCIWHETANIDVGDSLWVLEAFCQTQLILVCPQGRYSTWNWGISLGQLIQVNHLLVFVVFTFHCLDWSGVVLLIDECSCYISVGIGLHGQCIAQ